MASTIQGMARSHLALVTLALALAGCTDRLGPFDVAGTYILQSVNGAPVPLPGIQTQASGALTLTATGFVERRVSYTIDGQGTLQEFVATGTFQLTDAGLRLALHQGASLWTPTADLVGATITLQYPSPADGPDIVELYRLR